jgi:hypothetical protein
LAGWDVSNEKLFSMFSTLIGVRMLISAELCGNVVPPVKRAPRAFAGLFVKW